MAAKDVPQKLFEFPYDSEWDGLRLKEIIKQLLPDLGSRSSFLIIRNGLVSIGTEETTDPDSLIDTGSSVIVDLRHGIHGRGTAKHPHLHERMKVLHDDDHIVVVSKRAGTLVQPTDSSGDEGKGAGAPLIELLKHYWKAKAAPAPNPIVVQRLDKDTSGLLVLAKTVRAGRSLQQQLRPPRKMKREYMAIVHGIMGPDKGIWKTHFGRGAGSLRQSLAEERTGPDRSGVALQLAETRFRVLQRFEEEGMTLLGLQLETGRTHQIRIHCAESGHPVIGDGVYPKLTQRLLERLATQKFTPRSKLNPAQEALRMVQELGMIDFKIPKLQPKRLMLHATKLSFEHPAMIKRVTFEDEMPPDMKRLIEKQEEKKPVMRKRSPLKRAPKGKKKVKEDETS